MKTKKLQKGFTLLELVIVFGIIGIISVIGFSAFTSYSRVQVLDQSATEVRSALEKAKFDALSRVKPEVCDTSYPISGYEFMLCNGTDPSCQGDYEVRALCVPGPGQSSTRILSGTLPDSVAIVQSAETCPAISYNILNGYENGACEIILTAYGNTRKVIVDEVGSIAVSDTISGGAFFTPTPTFDPFASPTSFPLPTATNIPTPTSVPVYYYSPTPTPTLTPTPTNTPTPTPTTAVTCASCTGRGNYLCPAVLWNPPYCSTSSGWGTCTLCP